MAGRLVLATALLLTVTPGLAHAAAKVVDVHVPRVPAGSGTSSGQASLPAVGDHVLSCLIHRYMRTRRWSSDEPADS